MWVRPKSPRKAPGRTAPPGQRKKVQETPTTTTTTETTVPERAALVDPCDRARSLHGARGRPIPERAVRVAT
jgi:hypothetical protein